MNTFIHISVNMNNKLWTHVDSGLDNNKMSS